MRTDLFMTYLKDQCECLLRVDRSTEGIQWIFRRMPPDSAGPQRVEALLSRGKVDLRNLRIHVYLLPPEVLPLSLYLPQDLESPSLRQAVCSELLPGLQYPDAYDLQNFPLSLQPNGHGDQMVVVSLLGKAVLPGIRRVLGRLIDEVVFVGDGLQFLRIDGPDTKTDQGKPYQVILRLGERYYIAAFRLGCHIASCSLSHATKHLLAGRHYLDQAAYLNIHQERDMLELPLLQPLHPPDEWRNLALPKYAYPLWNLARCGLNRKGVLDHSSAMNPDIGSKGDDRVPASNESPFRVPGDISRSA